jgi:hypothetical protein
MAVGDVVLKMSLRTLEEADAFSGFLTRFLGACGEAVDHLAAPSEAPFVMVTTEPGPETDLRTVTFQEPDLAAAFARGWDCARGEARSLRLI